MSTIAIDPDIKEMLKELKVAPEESFNSVVRRFAIEAKKTINPCFQGKRNKRRKNLI